MNVRPLAAAILGAITLFVLGFLFYNVALESFFEENVGSAVGLLRAETGGMMLHAVFFGELAFAYLLVLVLPKLAKSNLMSAAKTAGLIGLLIGLGVNLVLFGVYNMGTLLAHAVDPLLFGIRWAAAGAVVSHVLAGAKP